MMFTSCYMLREVFRYCRQKVNKILVLVPENAVCNCFVCLTGGKSKP